MINANLTFELVLLGPVLTRDTGPAAFGLDAAMARNAQGRPILPYSLVKGRLREAMSELRQVAPIKFPQEITELFGSDSGDASKGQDGSTHNAPMRGLLRFSDFIFDLPPTGAPQKAARHRIAIDSELGSVKTGALLVAEDCFRAGVKNVRARGTISFLAANESIARETATRITLALAWIPQLGSGRTTGFGRLDQVSLVDAQYRPFAATLAAIGRPPAAVALAIRPQVPFCFSQNKIGGNLFESYPYIPGNAIKGSVMTMVAQLGRERFQALADHIDVIRFRHAFPSVGKERAAVAPLSVVAAGGMQYDAAAHKTPILIRGQAPVFRVDWKSAEKIRCDAAFGWRSPERALQVRTAMDSTRRKSREGALFAQETILPGDTIWRGMVDFPRPTGTVEEAIHRKAGEQLRCIFDAGLHSLGKTKAFAKIECSRYEPPPETEAAARSFRLTLQSAALLADPRFQNLPGAAKAGAISRDDLCQLYAAAWRNLSDGALTLSHYFASQSLAGGNYLYYRFQAQSGKPYRPFLLTDPGSVFVLDAVDPSRAMGYLEEWLRHGLPLPGWAIEEFTNHWEMNPFVRENGFGEVALNLQGDGIGEPTEVQSVQS